MTILHTDISLERLNQYIRTQTGNDQLMLGEWSYSSLGWKASNNVTGGLYRFDGTAYEHDKSVKWSLILKVVIPSLNHDELSHYNYWKREVLVYQSGLLNKLPPMIRAPRYFGIEEKDDKSFWIWLEEASSYIHEKWAQPQYEEAARVLGRFNGKYLVDEPIPSDPWLCRGWLSSWVEECDKYDDRTTLDENTWKKSIMNDLFPPNIFERYIDFHNKRVELMDGLRRLPMVLTHNDAWSPNLFLQEDETIIAIDWSFVGLAGIGEELGRFYGLYLNQSGPPKETSRLADAMFKQYCHGLDNVGWKGDTRLVRFGFLASAGIRCGMLIPKIFEQTSKGNRDSKLEEKFQIALHLLEFAEEAASLIPHLTNGQASVVK
jgi:hypothetical protein